MRNDAFDTVYDDPFDTDLKYFKGSVMKDMHTNAGNSENPKWFYFGDVARAEDIEKHIIYLKCRVLVQLLHNLSAASKLLFRMVDIYWEIIISR